MQRNSQEIYQQMDVLTADLKTAGQQELADVIFHRVHKVTWTSRSELLGELRTVLTSALEKGDLSALMREKLQGGLIALDREIKAASVPFKPA